MPEFVDDLTVKTEKPVIVVKTDKNWCDMPPEIKLECIKTMDVKMRARLRSTSRTERALVDKQKCHINELRVEDNPEYDQKTSKFVIMESNTVHFYVHGSSTPNDVMSRLVKILKTCDIGSFHFSCKRYSDQSIFDELDQLIDPDSIRTKRFHLQLNDKYNGSIFLFLKKISKNVESIVLSTDTPRFPMNELIAIPSVANARTLRIFDYPRGSYPFEPSLFVEKWIENDVKVGTILQNKYHPKIGISSFRQKFRGKPLLLNGASALLIETNNPAKNILMTYKFEPNKLFNTWTLISVVIPSGLNASEYDRYTRLPVNN